MENTSLINHNDDVITKHRIFRILFGMINIFLFIAEFIVLLLTESEIAKKCGLLLYFSIVLCQIVHLCVAIFNFSEISEKYIKIRWYNYIPFIPSFFLFISLSLVDTDECRGINGFEFIWLEFGVFCYYLVIFLGTCIICLYLWIEERLNKKREVYAHFERV